MSCYYDASSTKFLDDMMQGDMSGLYESFLEKVPDKGLILDAGCGSGRDSIYFKELGHMIVSMDPSEEVCECASEHIGQAVLFCNYEDIEFKIMFDGIWACGSLIELSDANLVKVLKRFVWLLKDKGTIYTSFIYGNPQEAKQQYYKMMDEETAEMLFREAGLKIDKAWLSDQDIYNETGKRWLNLLASKDR